MRQAGISSRDAVRGGGNEDRVARACSVMLVPSRHLVHIMPTGLRVIGGHGHASDRGKGCRGTKSEDLSAIHRTPPFAIEQVVICYARWALCRTTQRQRYHCLRSASLGVQGGGVNWYRLYREIPVVIKAFVS